MSWGHDRKKARKTCRSGRHDTRPETLVNLTPGGRLVINAIYKKEGDKKELLGLNDPEHLWQGEEIKSVANAAYRDIEAFPGIATGGVNQDSLRSHAAIQLAAYSQDLILDAISSWRQLPAIPSSLTVKSKWHRAMPMSISCRETSRRYRYPKARDR